ncbi:MAG TPA: tRNA (adenosine(37)-N6)-dimethylallyltransferase MiaA [Burkholderiales bacterium]|jgi:tRNA dimethylallyltransferase|nr:tRNA (adenosine(37)-N6)-dimethylallyltransferase MiaA [Burkholderiales bacterium]
MGPTASGKTAAALELVRHLPCDIISVDSAQVYRHMDIGTAKPDAATLNEAPHHLIDIVDPVDRYSAARFRADALEAMTKISAQGRIPLLAGGTMLYFKALSEGLSTLPEADAATRAAIDARAAREGWPALHAELGRLDPETAARLDPNDAQRIQRALEVCYVEGRPLSELLRLPKGTGLPYRVIRVALAPSDRSELHRRIAVRFDRMLNAGLVQELEGLRRRFALNPSLPAMRCVGYRQVWDHLDGMLSHTELRDKGIAATRQLAKRQLTWLRSTADVRVFDCLDANAATQALEFVKQQIVQGLVIGD